MAKTKVEKYREILELVKGNDELTEFINKEISLIEKANSNRKPTARQKENEELMITITEEFERMSDRGFITQKEFSTMTTANAIKELTPQRLSPMLRKLVAQNVLISVDNSKKVATYCLK